MEVGIKLKTFTDWEATVVYNKVILITPYEEDSNNKIIFTIISWKDFCIKNQGSVTSLPATNLVYCASFSIVQWLYNKESIVEAWNLVDKKNCGLLQNSIYKDTDFERIPSSSCNTYSVIFY